ncbi:hypothetical protein DWB85_12450 [Seongchinamella sediminis]|uniref:Type I restriction modification DNA specificity domain-containing protein n=1 Tax=Seongchinamella sediminis TaxID=2283635 RepID=A0A3L7DY53_9GAMM|nr:restriction endonuclease subunit S [Seongchinamella sediminis]RLQ21559.1 hypothetical protein DWB85_12450 [Seongchinamella sediminis]
MKWPLVEIDKVAQVNPRLPKGIDETQIVSFIGMASVSEDGKLLSEEDRVLAETKKGFTYFTRQDVLLAKITPCFENGKCLHAGQISHEVGFGSTEFHVIRANPDELDAKYLFYLVWNNSFRFYGQHSMSGAAGQKRVSADFIKKFKIPLPPLKEQKRIAAILNKANNLRRKRQQTIQLADEFLRAVFLDMFGGGKFPRVTIGEICDVKGGKRLPKGEEYANSKTNHAYLRVVDFKNRGIDTRGLKYISEATHKKIRRYVISHEDVYISIAGTIGLAGIVPAELSGSNLTENAAKLVIRDKGSVCNEYLAFWLSTPDAQRQIKAKTMLTSQPKLALFRIEELEVPLPKYQEQIRFLKIKNRLEKGYFYLEDSRSQGMELFNALSQKAFSGEL